MCNFTTQLKYVCLLASRLSKYLASQNTFQELLRTLIGKLLCEIFLHARLYLYHNWIFCGNYTITITLSQCSRNVNMILNLLINTSRTFFWLRFFLFNSPSFWNTYAVKTNLCVYFPSVTEQLIKRNLPKRNFHETICLQIMQSWPNIWSIWMFLKCWKLLWVFRSDIPLNKKAQFT